MKQITYKDSASSFWLGDLDNGNFKDQNNRVDYTKLTSAQRAIANFVNIVTGKQIPVEFQSNDHSYTNGQMVVIGTKLDGKNFDPAVGLALHEGSHIAYTNFSILQNFPSAIRMRGVDPDFNLTADEESTIKSLLNWIEDRRIDYLIYKKAPGYRMYYEAMYDKYFNDRVIDKALKNGTKNNESLDDYFFHIINFTNPNRNLNQLELLNDIWNIIDIKNIDRLKNTNDALDVACDVFIKLKAHLASIKPQEENKISTGKGGNGESIDDNNPNDIDTKQEIEAQSNSNNTGLTPRQEKMLDNALNKQKDFLSGTTKKSGRLTKTQSNLVKALKEAGTEVVNVNVGGTIVESIVINKLTKNIINSMPEIFNTRPASSRDKSITEGIRLGKILGRKLKVRNESRSLKHTRLETGKIDRRLISQLGYDNANVFHRIVTDRYKDYFIHISIDASGSMFGKKFSNSLTSAVAIAQAASMTTGIRVQISLRGTSVIGGGNRDRSTTIIAYDSRVDKMIKIKTLFKHLHLFGGTPEGVAFKSIEKTLAVNSNGVESIFINYSDGYPTDIGNRHIDPKTYTRNVIKQFKESGMQIISYFITGASGFHCSDTFKYMYGNDASNIDPKNMMSVAKSLNTKFLEQI